MSASLANELVTLLLAGVFGALIGWFLRRLMVEEGMATADSSALRDEVASRDRDLAALQGRLDALSVRHTLTENDLREAHTELGDRERQVRELEADLSVHARNSERALRSDDEVASLREGIRRAESARRAADDARAALEGDLDGVRRELATRDSEMRAAAVELASTNANISELETLLSQSREAEGRLRARAHDAELVVEALRRRVSELEPLAVRAREAEVLLTVAARDKDAEIAALREALEGGGRDAE